MTNKPVSQHDWRTPAIWAPLVTCWFLALLVATFHANQMLFLLLNGNHNESLWSSLTILGDSAVAIVLLLPFCARAPRLISALFIAVLLGGILVHVPKMVFDVTRPAGVLAPEQIQIIGPRLMRESFPSGHATTAFIVAGLLILHWRSAWRWLLLLPAMTVALSRIIVGAHWPLDILTGAGLGWLTAVLATDLARRWTAVTTINWQRGITALLVVLDLAVLFMHDTRYPLANWLQESIGIAVLILAAPGLRQLFRQQDRQA